MTQESCEASGLTKRSTYTALPQQSINVTFLGTGCDYSSPERESICILIERSPIRILLECCPGILQQLTAVNREPTEIGTVFTSHMHVGHFLGLPVFVFGNIPKGRKMPLRIIVPSATKDKVLRLLEWTVGGIGGKGLVEIPKHPFPIEILEASAEDVSSFKIVEDVTLVTAPVKHGVESLGCAIEFGRQEMKIAYSGDTLPCENVLKLAKDADLLIHDAFFEDDAREWANARGHSTARQAAEIAQKAQAKILALVHFHWTRYNRKDFIEKVIKEAKEVFEGRVIAPKDLETIDLLSYHTKPFAFPVDE